MYKQQILEALKTKFTGVKDEILERIASNLAKTVKDEAGIKTAVDGVDFQQVLTSYGDARANQARDTAVAGYEEKYGLKDGKPVQQQVQTGNQGGQQASQGNQQQQQQAGGQQQNPKPAEEVPAWAQTIIDQNKSLTDRLNQMEREKVGTSRQAKVDAMLKDAPEDIRNLYLANFKQMEFKDDAAFDGWIETSSSTVKTLTDTYRAKGAVTHQPRGGQQVQQQGEVDPLVKARAEARQTAQSQGSVIQGLPPTTA